MRAAFIEEFSDSNNIQIGEIESPEAGEGEVLVRVKAAGVNPVDGSVLQGHLDGFIPHEFPVIPGWDMAGIVEERGFGARRFEEGDDVYALVRRPVVQWGTFAEQIVVPESYLSRQPKNIPHVAAAAMPLVGLTAYQALYEAGNLEAGQTVVILGASGGVGSFGIQLAKVKNTRVIGVASDKNHDFMKRLGCDKSIDYEKEDIGEAVLEFAPKGVDLIFDCADGETLEQSLKALKEDGKLVSILNRGDDLDPNIDFEFVFVEPNTAQLKDLRELVESGQVEVPVTETYSLEQTAEAIEQIRSGHTKGKIVIVP